MTVQCPTCFGRLSADLLIYTDLKGFEKVTLGIRCKTCRRTYKDFWPVVQRIRAAKRGATVA